MNQDLDEIIQDFHQRAFGEELARVNQLPIDERRAYVRRLWESRARRSGPLTDDDLRARPSQYLDAQEGE